MATLVRSGMASECLDANTDEDGVNPACQVTLFGTDCLDYLQILAA